MAASKGTILVVDDESDSLTLLAGILTDQGYQVRPADSGKLALEAVAAAPPDLILLDLRMPRMDGLEVCRQLKARKETREIPIMFLSASTDREDRVTGMELGAVDFLAKPFFRPELLARIHTHLELSRLRSKLEVQVARRTEELVLTVKRLHQEIAERERTEQALRESEGRFRNMANAAPVMIWAAGADKQCDFFNKHWLEFTGRTLDQELGDGWTAAVHPDHLENAYRTFSAAFDDRRKFEIEFLLRRADGEYRWVLDDGVPRFEPDGTFAGYIGSAIDITDLKRNQEVALVRQKLESLGVLASGIAHDFNNLLGTVIADSELLEEELEENAPAQETARNIAKIAMRAAEIVRQLMTYAGQEGGASEPVNLASLVREMLQLIHVSISKRAVLKINLPDNLPLVRGNPAQLRQVVMNLITNASEAIGDKDGVISVTAAQVPSNLPQVDYIRLEVSDTGVGMSEELQARIFDPYFTTKFAGRGLGLAAVQGIVRSHGGTISVTSAPGQGSRFSILLPGSAESSILSREEQASAASQSGNLTGTILLVEDEDTLRLAVAKSLRRIGLTVIEAADGKAAVDLFPACAPQIDVVLLDLTVPGMSAREVLTELRRIQPDLKVIVTSAYSQSSAAANLGQPQSWSYIRKPYALSSLVGLLRDAGLGRQSHGSGGHV